MKRLFLIVLAGILLFGCERGFITGSGNTVTITRNYIDFTNLEISDAIDVTISQSDRYRIEIEVDDNLTQYLKTSKSGNTLIIELENGRSYNNINVKAFIEMPNINRIELSGASDGYISGFDFTHSFKCELSGASYLNGQITCGDISLDLSGASDIFLIGNANDMILNCSGASNAELASLPIDDADIDLSGGSHATITIEGALIANLSGGSILEYYGNPTISALNLSGGSTINHKN